MNINFEELLNKDGELFYTNVGFSMYPLIKQREDILHIKKDDNYKKGDIALYKSNGRYVLHRIVRKKKDKYIFMGDYNYFFDKPVEYNQILGKLISIKKRSGNIIILSKDKKMRKFFYTNFPHIKMVIQYILTKLHLRRIR